MNDDVDRRWLSQAACRGVDPDLFFPDRGEPTDAAKMICDTCPVRAECLDYAIAAAEKFGIWGGMSERQRRAERRRRSGGTGRTAPRCGTRSGYGRHRSIGEAACAECRAANAAYLRGRAS